MEDVLGRKLSKEEAAHRVDLHMKGAMNIPIGKTTAIIGSRKASAEGVKLARKLATEKECVISGLAEGIDRAAHIGAIFGGKQTIAVLGTPLDENYPAANKELQDLIMEKYLCLSQFPSGSMINRSNFVKRNHTIAVLADSCIIVESSNSGGALYVAKAMKKMKKPVFACNINKGQTWVNNLDIEII